MGAPSGPLDHARAVDLVEREAAAFAALLAEGAECERPVPACPGWTLADLARHLGGVHRWARTALSTDPDGDPGDEPSGPSDPVALRSWFAQGAADLVADLRAADGDRPCWTFGPPQVARFWSLRQAVETAIHRWDAESTLAGAGAAATALDTDLAIAGLVEVATMITPRQVRLGRLAPSGLVVALGADTGERVLLGPAGSSGTPSATVTGPASSLLLLLWRRTTLDDPALSVDGEPAGGPGGSAALRAALSGALTP